VATWNCFGAPPTPDHFLEGRCFWPERLEAREVRETFAGYDIVCVQENLVPCVRESLERLRRAAGFAELWCDPMGPDPDDNTFVGGGLAILSRFSLQVRFVRLPRGTGPDGFARKGYAVADVSLPSGARVHVVNTHLQADDPIVPLEDCRAARAAQLAGLCEVASALAASDTPTIVCGDFNVVYGSDEYEQLRRLLGDSLADLAAGEGFTTYDVGRNDLALMFHPGGPDCVQLDYIWASSSRVEAAEVRLLLEEPLADVGGCPPSCTARPFSSDHFGMGATLEIEG